MYNRTYLNITCSMFFQSSVPTDILETSKESDSSIVSDSVVVNLEPAVDAITLQSEEFTAQQTPEKDESSSHVLEEKGLTDKTDVAVKEVSTTGKFYSFFVFIL